MGHQSTNGVNKLQAGDHPGNVRTWLILGVIGLMMLGSNLAPVFGIPWWVFMVIVFALAMVLATQSSSQTPDFLSVGKRQLSVIVAIGISILFEAIWFGVYQQNWSLFAVWLTATLLIGIMFYLIIAVVVENTILPLYLLVPTISFLFGGLLWLVWSDFGYINLFLLCFTLLSFSASLWLRFRQTN